MPGAAYQERVLADGPLAYWPLDDVENASRTPDVSGNGHDANLDDANGSGSIAFDAAGAAGTTGASLDNRGSIFVGLPNPLGFGSGSYTLEAWIRLDEGDGADLLSANDPGGPGYATFYDTMFTAVTHKRYDGSGGFETMDQQGILLDTLRHIAIVFDAALGEGQIYVDGEPTQLPPFPLTLSWTTSSTFVLGRAANDSTITLDEVAVYDRVLDAEEVAAHFDCADGCSE